jgi:integrase
VASIQRLISRRTGEVTYRAQVRLKGKPPVGKTFPNRKEAKEWAGALEAAVREHRYFPHARASRTTFAEVAKRYRERTLAEMPARNRRVRSKQLEWWERHLKGLPVAEITPDRIAEARDELALEPFVRGKARTTSDGAVTSPREFKRSPATVNRYLEVLNHLFTVSVREWRLVDRNPVRDVAKKKEPRGRIRFLSDDEREALLQACGTSTWPGLRPLVMLAITTGARRGELINLKWTDIDLKAGEALVRESKNDEPRVLPLLGKALEVLRAHKLNGGAKTEWVFLQPSGIPGPYQHFDAHWKGALTAAKIDGFKFHDLRHTCASYLAQNGASLLEIAEVLGHKTLAMVKRYAHLTQKRKVAVIERMLRERGM